MRRLILWLVLAFVPAVIGAFFPAPDYYQALERPAFAPPPWLFGPVWTVLYALIGLAAWLVDQAGGRGKQRALVLWGVQLALNAAWTPVFFGLRDPGLGLLVIAVLWLAVLATTVVFFARRRAAGVLLIPYLAWVSFATWLNFELWRLN